MKWIAILEDNAGRAEAMRQALKLHFAGFNVHFCDNAPDMIEWLKVNLNSTILISLDHDLEPNVMRKDFDPLSGREVAEFLATQSPVCPVIIHTSNYIAAPSMINTLQETGWKTARSVPFSDLLWIDASWISEVMKALAH
jgi:hypothetical protein